MVPDGVARLQLLTRTAFVNKLYQAGYHARAPLVGFNLPFDLSRLALDVSPATEGALGVARVLAGVTDCLAVPRVTPADLDSGEPGFHLVGAKSYGRLPTFLLRNGIEQLTTILDGLAAPA